MAGITNPTRLTELISRLESAVRADGDSTCCHNVKKILQDVVASGEEFLDARFLKPAEGCYARRLVHRDGDDQFSLLAMVWDVGQGAALHDHAGHWCCECVYRGRIKVVQYSLQNSPDAEVLKFQPEGTIYAGVGEAGALIPPFDYHSIENDGDAPAVTLHVYKGELTWCHAFVPTDGGFKKTRRELTYTP